MAGKGPICGSAPSFRRSISRELNGKWISQGLDWQPFSGSSFTCSTTIPMLTHEFILIKLLWLLCQWLHLYHFSMPFSDLWSQTSTWSLPLGSSKAKHVGSWRWRKGGGSHTLVTWFVPPNASQCSCFLLIWLFSLHLISKCKFSFSSYYNFKWEWSHFYHFHFTTPFLLAAENNA